MCTVAPKALYGAQFMSCFEIHDHFGIYLYDLVTGGGERGSPFVRDGSREIFLSTGSDLKEPGYTKIQQ